MKIDNFELVANEILSPFFETVKDPDIFFFVQVLIRHKDGHSGPGSNGDNSNRLVKYYTIRSVEELYRRRDEIIGISDLMNARAYIHPSPRSFKLVASQTLLDATATYVSENYIGMKSIFSSAAGKSYITKYKRFIVDLDDDMADESKVAEISSFLESLEPTDRPKGIKVVPTLHGCHLVTYPFNTKAFGDRYPSIDIHKNNPTLLYYNRSE